MGVTGTDLSKCLASYIESLKEKGITVDINPDDVVTPGTNEDKTPDTSKLTASGTNSRYQDCGSWAGES